MIERVLINQYKSIRDAKIDLRNINILIGQNGAGKSNFITFFELLHALCVQRLGNYVITHGGGERLLYNGSKVSKMLCGGVDFDNKNAFFFDLRPTIDDKLYIPPPKTILILDMSKPKITSINGISTSGIAMY